MENEFMDQFLENRQNYMMDNNSIQQLNVASAGDAVVGGVQSEVVSGVAGEILGGKYDEHREEHDVGDDDELKYVEEVQQSEKQQQQQLQTLKNIGLDDESNELAEKETSKKAVHEFGNGNGGFVFGGDHHSHEQQPHHDLFSIGNGHNTNGHDIVNINDDFGTLVSTGFEEKLNLMESELDGFKNEGDFSSTSNVTEPAEEFVPQIDVKIEAKVEHHEMVDEEEPSSLATNTTNGTSSLSENIPPQVNIDPQANALDLMAHFEDKENSDPLISQRPNDLDLDLDQAQSQLNPDAKEFIPSFGSNPASPTSPFATGALQTDPVLSDIVETQMYFGQAPSVVPRHLMEDDDFVAQSPCKGENDNNMDTVLVPRELSEFEQEADKRPHSLELEEVEGLNQRDEVMTPDQAIQQLPLDDIATQEKENDATMNSADFLSSNFMDHGPETCVDHEADLDMQPTNELPSVQADNDDVMKRSIYIASDDVIEDVLNSVQPIPTEIDSVNNSFIEESATESAANQLAGDKELLQVEEKEHVSHSPSTEEIQMNLQNNFSSSNKDISQLPVDMQQSLFMKEEQNIFSDDKDSKKLSSDNPFELENMLTDQQQSVQAVQIETPLFFQDYTPEFENKALEEENQVKAEKQETDEQQYIEQLREDHLPEKHQTENTHAIEITETILLAANPLTDLMEHQQETNDSFSPYEIIKDVSNTCTFESLNETRENLQQPDIHAFESLNESPANLQQTDFIDVDMTPSFAVDEKHLLEETKEQQLFSVSGLEQQMSEMLLNNTDGNLSQAEEVAASPAIDDISDNLINADEGIEQEEQFEEQAEPAQTEHLTLVDDSFISHELESQQQEQEEQEIVVEPETKSHVLHETLENNAVQQHQDEFEREIVAVEEPLIETKQATTLLTNEETEKKTEEKPELPICMVPDTAPAEVLEPTVTTNNETEVEIEKKQEEQPEEVKTEIVKELEIKELKENDAEPVKETVTAAPEIFAKVPVEAAIVAAAAAVATTATVAAKSVTSTSTKKPIAKTTTVTAKSKVAATTAAKKPVEAAKKPVGLAAKPRTVPAKPTAGTTDKKTTTTTTTLANRKPTTTSNVATKTTSTTSSARTLTAAPKTNTTSKLTTTTSKPLATPRTLPSSTLTARKPTTTNGSLAKPRPASAPSKPTTLGLSATNGAPKTKPLSPRSTLTSQVRKTAPATAAAKSPVKTTAANGVPKTASSTLASRTKTTTSTVPSTAGTATKTFTARPAPKFNSSSSSSTTTTTTRRSVAAVSNTSSNTTTTLKANSSPLRKSTPTKPVATRTPTKSATGGLKSKTPITKPAASPEAKPAPIRKPVDKTIAAAAAAAAATTNASANADKQLNGLNEEQLNGDMQAVQQKEQQNGNSSIPMQTENVEQPFLETRDEQIPMDLINA